MKVGGRRELIIPAKDAYGAQGQPPTIKPNAALVFVVDLLDVQPPSAAAGAAGAAGGATVAPRQPAAERRSAVLVRRVADRADQPEEGDAEDQERKPEGEQRGRS